MAAAPSSESSFEPQSLPRGGPPKASSGPPASRSGLVLPPFQVDDLAALAAESCDALLDLKGVSPAQSQWMGTCAHRDCIVAAALRVVACHYAMPVMYLMLAKKCGLPLVIKQANGEHPR